MRRFVLLAACTALAGCASAPPVPCRAGEQPAASDLLYFGTARPRGVVSAQEWQQFLERSVTPRFPQGLSVWPAAGQWRGADGQVVREGSHVLNLVHPDDEASEKAVQEIVSAYKAQFEQEAVLRVRSRACSSL
ncbi:DUF3574 domain-containing protein [Piscinibacter sp. XHJ-5]|uniref:DUF3574 domain-containing protein n=1 Tax=Piscinibacter sp. XHJ-5 TaxID=3037797 RepID=UPI002452E2DD|nr:DUF3574 domain-containing protein [Piscinibacter sp. XHJ-5]